jgi:hypothetical protein
MAGKTIGSTSPGDVDAEVADRAARRIKIAWAHETRLLVTSAGLRGPLI